LTDSLRATKSIIAPFLKLRMATALTDMSKHNFNDHQNASNRIHSLVMVLMHLILVRRGCKTPCCTKTHFKGSRLGPKSYQLKTYFVAQFLTIPKLSLNFL
jgi:hypothetical protein